MKEIHILVTGVGRRVELMQAFRQAALQLDINLKIYGADMAGTAPALAYCDYSRKVCAMRDPDYIHQLVEICLADKIDLVMPTIDTDLLVLSQNVKEFEEIGVKVLISKADKIMICRDKNHTGDFFESCGLKAPKTYNDYKAYPGPYPCFIKPKDGSSSIDAYKVEDETELAVYAGQVEDYVIQPFISGREYTIDIFCDFEGHPIYITPRQRLQVRAGEVLKTEIHMDETMIAEAQKLCQAFQPCGPITVQLIQDGHSGDNYYIEINPRYGGGAPLSMKSGARSTEALLRLLAGENVAYQKDASCNGAIYSRFDQSVCISEGDDTQPIKGVIFDLDDTLYSEKEYVRSGYQKIAAYLTRETNREINREKNIEINSETNRENDQASEKMWAYFQAGKPAIDAYLAEIGQEEQKAACLEIYRQQMPDIHLYDGVIDMIQSLKEGGIKVGIITDGRPEGQRHKIAALGLDKVLDLDKDIIITDELGGIQFRKPCDIAFRIMQNRWRLPYEQIIYVGDNPNKDFTACKQLGMRYLYFRNPDGIYYDASQTEQAGLRSIEEMREKLGGM